jgi:predicted nuclease of predicted toxin-antitoxin system
MDFLADENISTQVVDRLRKAGFRVARVAQLIRPGATDEEILARANKDNLILITKDDDFGALVVRHKHKVRGLILAQVERLSKAARDERIVEAVTTNTARFDGNLVVIRPDHITVRSLT